MRRAALVTVLIAFHAVGAFAQSTVNPSKSMAYSANAAWINFHPSASNGVSVTEAYLSGFAWAANIGWLNFGDGSPVNGYLYGNADGDFGVNLNLSGFLDGFAWSANVGWINFSWAQEDHPNAPRIDFLTGRFRGLAYSANVGWITLDSPGFGLETLTIACPDSDNDTIGDAWEWKHFQSLSIAGTGTNSDGDDDSDATEYLADTNPKDASDFLRILSSSFSLDGGSTGATLEFSSRPSRLYRIEHSAGLSLWTDSGEGVFPPDSGGSTFKTVSASDDDQHYFRVVAVKPLQQ